MAPRIGQRPRTRSSSKPDPEQTAAPREQKPVPLSEKSKALLELVLRPSRSETPTERAARAGRGKLTGAGGAASGPQPRAPQSGAARPAAARSRDATAAERQRIIDTARRYVGTVDYAVRDGGEPKGWRVVQELFVAMTDLEPTADELRASWKPSNKSWCGIFALWVYRQAGVYEGTWDLNQGRPGAGIRREVSWDRKWKKRADFEAAIRPGDIVIFPERSHHAIVVAVEGDRLVTLDGNGTFGRITERTDHRLSEVVGFYSPRVDAPPEGTHAPQPSDGGDR